MDLDLLLEPGATPDLAPLIAMMLRGDVDHVRAEIDRLAPAATR